MGAGAGAGVHGGMGGTARGGIGARPRAGQGNKVSVTMGGRAVGRCRYVRVPRAHGQCLTLDPRRLALGARPRPHKRSHCGTCVLSSLLHCAALPCTALLPVRPATPPPCPFVNLARHTLSLSAAVALCGAGRVQGPHHPQRECGAAGGVQRGQRSGGRACSGAGRGEAGAGGAVLAPPNSVSQWELPVPGVPLRSCRVAAGG